MLQEWDALMLESHQQRTALITARQELAHALYQQDAAVRVIARCAQLISETALSLVSSQLQHHMCTVLQAGVSGPSDSQCQIPGGWDSIQVGCRGCCFSSLDHQPANTTSSWQLRQEAAGSRSPVQLSWHEAFSAECQAWHWHWLTSLHAAG